MAIVSFDEIEYQSGEAVVKEVEVAGNIVRIWFKLEDGQFIRETYRMGFQKERNRLKAVAEVFFGDVTGEIDLEEMVGQTCLIELEERPWKEGQPWIGVRKVLPAEPAIGPEYETEVESEYETDYEYEQSLQSDDLSNTVIRPRKIAKELDPVTEPAMDKPLPVRVSSERRRPAKKGDGLGREALRKLQAALKAKQAEQAKEQEQLFDED